MNPDQDAQPQNTEFTSPNQTESPLPPPTPIVSQSARPFSAQGQPMVGNATTQSATPLGAIPFSQANPQAPSAPVFSTVGDNNASLGNAKKKKIAIIVGGAILLLAIVFAGFTFLKEPVGNLASNMGIGNSLTLEEYKNDKLGFSINAPKGWTSKVTDSYYDDSGFGNVSFVEPSGDVSDTSESNKHFASLKVNLDRHDTESSQLDEAEFFEGYKKALQSTQGASNESDSESSIEEKSKVESEKMVTVNGLSAYKVKLKIDNYGYEKGEVGYEYSLIVYVDKTKSYGISLSAHESESSIIAKADKIIESFKNQK